MSPEKITTTNNLSRDIIIGMSEGLSVPFALAAGLSGAVDSAKIVVTSGLAVIIAGSFAMGMGGYFSGKVSDHHHHEDDILTADKPGSREFFAKLGMSEEMQVKALEEVAKDQEKWSEIIHGREEPVQNDSASVKRSAFTIGISYAIGGLVPIFPYFFNSDVSKALIFSSIITLVFLFVMGWIRSNLNGERPLEGAIRLSLISMVAAAAAYGVARLFIAD